MMNQERIQRNNILAHTLLEKLNQLKY